jgi:hypothetical protein
LCCEEIKTLQQILEGARGKTDGKIGCDKWDLVEKPHPPRFIKPPPAPFAILKKNAFPLSTDAKKPAC